MQDKSNNELAKSLLELEALERALIRKKAETDIDFFAHHFLHHHLKCDTPLFHKEIYALLQTEKRLALAAPRSFAKSTITDVIFALHILLYGSKEDILIVSNSGALADELVRRVKFELETNETIRQIFGDQVNENKWTQDHIILANGNQLRGKGRGYQIRGFRPTRVILDDLEDDEMVRSKDQRDKLREWFLGALLNTLEPGQQLVYIGTLLHPLSLLKQIIDQDDPLFKAWTTRTYKALVELPDGNVASIWPEKWPVLALEARLAEIGPHKFQAEYMNNPLADSTVVFHPDTYKYYEEPPAVAEGSPFELIITGFDLVGSEKDFTDKDYVTFITLGRTPNKDIYCIDARRGHWTQEEIVKNFIEIHKSLQPRAFVGEEVNFQQIIHQYLLKETRRQDVYLPIQGIRLGSYTDGDKLRKAKDKVSRAMTVQHIFTQGLFYLKRTQRIFYEELSTFPSGDHDDQVDAMVHALHILTDKVKLEVMERRTNFTALGSTPAASLTLPKDRFKKLGIIMEDTKR